VVSEIRLRLSDDRPVGFSEGQESPFFLIFVITRSVESDPVDASMAGFVARPPKIAVNDRFSPCH
jgi:hypothetical protein